MKLLKILLPFSLLLVSLNSIAQNGTQRTNTPSRQLYRLIEQSSQVVHYQLGPKSESGNLQEHLLGYQVLDQKLLSLATFKNFQKLLLIQSTYLKKNLARSCPFVAEQ